MRYPLLILVRVTTQKKTLQSIRTPSSELFCCISLKCRATQLEMTMSFENNRTDVTAGGHPVRADSQMQHTFM